ncbi:MAG: hypothetical protein ACJAZP_003322 [Psychromonas sp.]|jgi:hypothetical protein
MIQKIKAVLFSVDQINCFHWYFRLLEFHLTRADFAPKIGRFAYLNY